MRPLPHSRLKFVLNTWTICNLPEFSAFPSGLGAREAVAFIREAGYYGLQMALDDPMFEAAREAGMHLSGTARVVCVEEVETVCRSYRDRGFDLATLHVGTGFETQREGVRLLSAVLETSRKLQYPLYVETHRATLTQDPRRTLDLIASFPEVLLNGDLSQWYAGCEMTYGDFEAKLDALEPVFSRIRYLHGRMSDSSCVQVPVADAAATISRHFHEMWLRSFRGFLEHAQEDACVYFAPELLPNSAVLKGELVEINYARLKQGPSGWVEETDRWSEGLSLCAMAQRAFDEANASFSAYAGIDWQR